MEGVHHYRTDRDLTIRAQQEYSGIENYTIARETYDMTQPGMPPTPRPAPSALCKALDIMSMELPATGMEGMKADSFASMLQIIGDERGLKNMRAPAEHPKAHGGFRAARRQYRFDLSAA